MKILALTLFLFSLVLLPGCFFSRAASVERSFYDLGTVQTRCSVPVDIGSIRNASGADRRFLYRMKGNRIEFDSRNFWLTDPDQAVEKLLRNSFVSGGSDALHISGVIDDFGFEPDKKLAVLTVNFTLKQGEKRENVRCGVESAFDGKSAASAAGAMKSCAEKAVKQLADAVEKFSKK